MKGFLKIVVDVKNEEINQAKRKLPLTAIRHDAEHTPVPVSFADAMADSTREAVGIIAEIKKASPSKGDIRTDIDVTAYADACTQGGARAISVLTESKYFKGTLSDLELVCQHTDLPVLRKDFIFSEYQIYEAKKAGASAVLLITTLLDPAQQSELTCLTRELGMEPLMEINSEFEFEQAYTAKGRVVGINNRNLSTLEVDTSVAKRVAKIFPDEIIPVEASGISGRSGIEAGIENRILNFLVGESIVRSEDPAQFIRTLTGIKEKSD
ncbi:MAG: indole-3-glycerol phosphate synthase [Desulfobacter postgatei]|uniref:indole-3-glycerol-phosphate synthase n=1 Tax=Desulfobacter postgatei TaxID=2293 RepID=A0A2G6MTK9_9BACT|nr:MAG: indole-3-glycerol phosphate synthase [Desulfobacter postgatei]